MHDHNARLAVVSCTPMAKITGPLGDDILEPLDPRWHRSRMGLSFGTNINASEICIDGMEIGDARSRVAARCLSMTPRPFCVFFLDSDVIVPQDAFTKLFYHLKTKPHIDIACGIYVVKGAPPYDPLIYEGNGMGAFWDFSMGDILTTEQHGITACHMGLTLIRTSLFQRMIDSGLVHGEGMDQEDSPFFCTKSFRREGPKGVETFKGTEDIWFCGLAEKLDPPCQILVDTSVLAGHVDRKTGVVFGLPGNTNPIERAMWMPTPDGTGRRRDVVKAQENEEVCEVCKGSKFILEADTNDLETNECKNCKGLGKIKLPLKIAIDLGSGESRRMWKGYQTYRLDGRRESKPDYCQEMENLNLPDNHYDLVASRHSFEHVGRFQQERLWSETFRICKPGGKLEIIVPNAEWAAHKIVNGEMDMHTLNVLLGGAESDSEMKDSGTVWNIHKMLYTKDVITALAENAGFEDVLVRDWRDDPTMEYHMVLTATKPVKVEKDSQEEPSKKESTTNRVENYVVDTLSNNGDNSPNSDSYKEEEKCIVGD